MPKPRWMAATKPFAANNRQHRTKAPRLKVAGACIASSPSRTPSGAQLLLQKERAAIPKSYDRAHARTARANTSQQCTVTNGPYSVVRAELRKQVMIYNAAHAAVRTQR